MKPRSRTNSSAVSCEVSSTSRTASAGRPALPIAVAERRGDDAVGLERAGRAPQQGGVARLEAQRRRVGGDVRAVLVDDPDDAERDAHPLDAQARSGARSLRRPRPPGRGSAATERKPVGHLQTTRASVSRSRSTTVGDAPAVERRATSLALALRISSRRSHEAIGRQRERLVLGRGGHRGERAGPPSWRAGRARAVSVVGIAPGYRRDTWRYSAPSSSTSRAGLPDSSASPASGPLEVGRRLAGPLSRVAGRGPRRRVLRSPPPTAKRPQGVSTSSTSAALRSSSASYLRVSRSARNGTATWRTASTAASTASRAAASVSQAGSLRMSTPSPFGLRGRGEGGVADRRALLAEPARGCDPGDEPELVAVGGGAAARGTRGPRR